MNAKKKTLFAILTILLAVDLGVGLGFLHWNNFNRFLHWNFGTRHRDEAIMLVRAKNSWLDRMARISNTGCWSTNPDRDRFCHEFLQPNGLPNVTLCEDKPGDCSRLGYKRADLPMTKGESKMRPSNSKSATIDLSKNACEEVPWAGKKLCSWSGGDLGGRILAPVAEGYLRFEPIMSITCRRKDASQWDPKDYDSSCIVLTDDLSIAKDGEVVATKELANHNAALALDPWSNFCEVTGIIEAPALGVEIDPNFARGKGCTPGLPPELAKYVACYRAHGRQLPKMNQPPSPEAEREYPLPIVNGHKVFVEQTGPAYLL